MSPDEPPPAKPAKGNDNQQGSGGGGRKNSSSTTTRPQEQILKCPRCDSPNTKFCYYNNYSLTQPRHFCKTCRRYWTKGGALRNVPIGGGCRKNKKMKSSSRLSCDSNNSGSSSELGVGGGLKFLHGLSPSLDFHLGGLQVPFPRLQFHHQTTPMFNQFSSFGDTSGSGAINLDPSSGGSNSLAGLSYPFTTNGYNGAVQGMNSMNIHTNLASSIESLSSMNQDLHWKLQQQRLSMMFGGDNQKDNNNNNNNNVSQLENQTQKPQPILFQNLELSKPTTNGIFSAGNSRKEGTSGDTPTEWFFGNSYGSVTPTPTASGGGGGGPGHDNGSNWSSGGVHAWGDVQNQQQQYSALP